MKDKVKVNGSELDAHGLHYSELNRQILRLLRKGQQSMTLRGVNGQRYIGAGIQAKAQLAVHGTPGNDLAAFADGLQITVYGNGQDAVANTMNKGKLVIHGSVGDLLGYSLRGGSVLIKGSAGYRAGVHMKQYVDQKPLLVIGGTAGDFLGEYMAGGDLVVLGLGCTADHPVVEDNIAPGMHGGRIILPEPVPEYSLGREVHVYELTNEDLAFLRQTTLMYSQTFGASAQHILQRRFVKVAPKGARPYQAMYA